MHGDLGAEIKFGDGPWNPVRARHMKANLYMIIVPEHVPLPPGLLKSPARVDVRIEGQPATYMHSNKLRVTLEKQVVFLAVTEPGSAWQA